MAAEFSHLLSMDQMKHKYEKRDFSQAVEGQDSNPSNNSSNTEGIEHDWDDHAHAQILDLYMCSIEPFFI